jgi:hypothetical protein
LHFSTSSSNESSLPTLTGTPKDASGCGADHVGKRLQKCDHVNHMYIKLKLVMHIAEGRNKRTIAVK